MAPTHKLDVELGGTFSKQWLSSARHSGFRCTMRDIAMRFVVLRNHKDWLKYNRLVNSFGTYVCGRISVAPRCPSDMDVINRIVDPAT
jgi:hypothetical protein